MDITYPSIRSVGYGSDVITTFNNTPGPITKDSGETFSLCLYTNCESGLDMTPCNYDIVSVSNSLIGTILGITSGSSSSPVVPDEPEDPAEPVIPEEPVVTEDANAKRAEELAKKAEEFYASLASIYDIEAEKAKEADFSDLYAKSAARAHGFTDAEKENLLLEEYLDKSEAKAAELKASNDLCIRVGAGELAGIMRSVLNAADRGISLTEALAAFAVTDEEPYIREKSGNASADLLWVNLESGEVTNALNKGRTVLGNDLAALYADDEAALKMADNLTAFIKYAMSVMSEEEEIDPERIRAFLAHLINKQVYADLDRYIQDLDSNADIEAVMNIILEHLTSAGVFGGGVDDNEGEEENEPVEGAEEGTLPALPTPEEELEEIKDGLAEAGEESEGSGEN